MKNKKRKIRKGRLFILVIFTIFIFGGCIKLSTSLFKEPQMTYLNETKNEAKQNEEIKTSNYKAVVTSNSEKNSDIVEEYFADGMSTEDYKKSIEKIDDYLGISGQYTKVSFDFNKKYHYVELEEIYKSLALSDIVKIEIIGKSVDNRNMYSIEIGKGEDVTMFEAGIHAAETASPLFITNFMVDLVNKYENGDGDTIKLLNSNKIVILPSANPDGYETAMWGKDALNNQNLYIAKEADKESLEYIKTNANGVDLNRNFPSQTAGLYYNMYDLHYTVSLDKSIDRLSYYPGDTLGSEPETRAIIYWQNKFVSHLKSYVALHTAGRVVYNGKPYLSDTYNDNSHECANIVGNITDYMVMSKADEEAGEGNDGTSSEYMAETISGFTFSSVTGRLSSDWYAKKYDQIKYEKACVIVIEALEYYTNDLNTIKREYYNYDLEKAYLAVINR